MNIADFFQLQCPFHCNGEQGAALGKECRGPASLRATAIWVFGPAVCPGFGSAGHSRLFADPVRLAR